MITLSNFVVLGIIEVYALFVGGLVVLIIYNRSLSLRIIKLRDLVQNLKQRLGQKKSIPKNNKPSFLESAILETKDHFNSIAPDKEISLNEALELEAFITALRYEFLNTENKAAKISDDEEKWIVLSNSLSALVNQLQASSDENDAPLTDETLEKLKSSWQDLCAAAIEMFLQKSSENEDNLMALFQLINSELGFEQLEVPERKPLSEQRREAYNKNVDTVNELKESAGETKKLIATLLSQKDAAESEVSIKTEELDKIQRFLNESEVCIKLLEDELEELKQALRAQQDIPNDTKDLQDLIQNFAKESSEMLTCIDTLEQENTSLRNKLSSEE